MQQVLGGFFPAVTHDPLLEKPISRHRVNCIQVIGDRAPNLTLIESEPEPVSPTPLRLVVSNGETADGKAS